MAVNVLSNDIYEKPLTLDAAEIYIRAERRLGEMLREQKETVGLAKGSPCNQYTGPVPEKNQSTPTLADVGIDKKLSSRAQKGDTHAPVGRDLTLCRLTYIIQ